MIELIKVCRRRYTLPSAWHQGPAPVRGRVPLATPPDPIGVETRCRHSTVRLGAGCRFLLLALIMLIVVSFVMSSFCLLLLAGRALIPLGAQDVGDLARLLAPTRSPLSHTEATVHAEVPFVLRGVLIVHMR